MKAVLFAGGFGTRLSEATNLIPKPMVEIGGKPILWHIMKTYSHYGTMNSSSAAATNNMSSKNILPTISVIIAI